MATSFEGENPPSPAGSGRPDVEDLGEVEAWNPDDLTRPPCLVTPETTSRPGLVATPYGDLRFLNVSGSMDEMAVDLGTRLSDVAHLGPVPFFADYLEKVFENSPLRMASGVLDWAANRVVAKRLRSNLPSELRRAIDAFARVAELPADQMYRAYLMPETFLYVLGTYHRVLGTDRATGLGAAPLFGCTSAITTPPRSDTVLHGRNFDYFGPDYWDCYATVVFHHPDDGLDYVAVSSAGILGGGITSMNSAGLTLVVHQHFPDQFDLDGVPVGVAGDRAIKHAHSIEEAVAILRAHPPVAGWTYVMTEGDTGRAAVYEVAPGKENLVWLDGDEAAMGYANVYWGEELEDVEVDYYPEYRRCNYARQERVRQCVMEIDGGGTPREIARILGDAYDPETGKERLLGPTILSVLTVASVVFEPEKRRVWVAAGHSPTSRGWFIPFDLRPDDGVGRGRPDMSADPFIAFPGWRETPTGKAFAFYREAAVGSLHDMPDERQLVLIEHALALDPDEPYLRVMAGLLALRLDRGRRAEGAFRRALESIQRPDRRAEIGLFLAWSLDLQGQRGAAKHLYKRVARDEKADDVFRTRAGHGRWFRFTTKQARRLNIDFTYGGVP